MSRVRCVLFDLDGTLVDTAPDLGYAANCVREEMGLPPLPEIDYRPVASAGARGLLKVALGLTPEDPDYPARRERFLAHYRANLSRASALFPGMERALAVLERDGIRWGVVTNKPQWLTDPLLAELELAARSACTIGAIDGIPGKPAPDNLLRACRELALPPIDCAYVGDDARDVVAARAAGMPALAAAWGYLGDEAPIETWGADAILATPEDLVTWCR